MTFWTSYLDELEASAQAAENLSDAEKNKLCISRETLHGRTEDDRFVT